jgi:hypothetical protein
MKDTKDFTDKEKKAFIEIRAENKGNNNKIVKK